MIKCTPLEYQPGSKHTYSDVDYMLLGFIIELVISQPFDCYVEESIYRPLSLTRAVFNPPPKGFKPQQVTTMELNGSTRNGVIHLPNIRTSTFWSQVYDGKAFYSMSGASRHAGLLSNTGGIAVLMQTMPNGGGHGDVQLFNAETVETFTTSSKENAIFGLGWRVNGNVAMTPTFDTLASP